MKILQLPWLRSSVIFLDSSGIFWAVLRFEVLTAVKMSMVVFVMILCGVVDGLQSVGGIYCLHLQA
jgi:hypothetical protein